MAVNVTPDMLIWDVWETEEVPHMRMFDQVDEEILTSAKESAMRRDLEAMKNAIKAMSSGKRKTLCKQLYKNARSFYLQHTKKTVATVDLGRAETELVSGCSLDELLTDTNEALNMMLREEEHTHVVDRGLARGREQHGYYDEEKKVFYPYKRDAISPKTVENLFPPIMKYEHVRLLFDIK